MDLDEKVPPEAKQVAVKFTENLLRRDYPAAYAMTTRSYRAGRSLKSMRKDFERVVSLDWKLTGSIVPGMSSSKTASPDSRAEDVGWVYVPIPGEVYSEAVMVVVSREDGELRIRKADFGRP